VAVRIRMKRMGRTHRPFYRICAFDQNTPRDGRALEELGTYDPNVLDTDARAVLDGERVAYWLSVGAQPSEKVAVLIKKYGFEGTHLEKQREALAKLAEPKAIPDPGAPVSKPKSEEDQSAAEAPAKAESTAEESAAPDESAGTGEPTETPAEEEQAAESKPAE